MDAVKNVASDALGLAKNAPKEIKRGTEETHSEAHQVGWPPPLSHLSSVDRDSDPQAIRR
jgi:hypothetical protein